MTHVRTLIALAAMAGFASVASAQSTSPSRAEVKAEAKAAEKSGQTATGELQAGAASKPKSNTVSTKPRSEVKSEAKAAEKSGQTAKGEGPNTYSGPEKAATGNKSGTTRADVKADRAMSKATAPAGQSQTVNTETSVPPALTSPAAATTPKK